MCDRLALMLFAYKISKICKRLLVAHWPVNRACGSPFERLFKTNAFPVFSENSYTPDLDIRPPIPLNFDLSLKKIVSTDVSVIQLAGYHGHNFDDFQSVFSFSEEVLEIANNFSKTYLTSEAIGLQVTVGKKRTQGIYAPSLDKYIETVDSVISQRGEVIFLSTDDPVVISPLRHQFGNRIQVLPMRSYDRSTTDSVIDAAASLHLLRSCKCVVGSSVSGFSILAGWDTKYIHVRGKNCINTDWWGNQIRLRNEI
jgi:hypothetical protein